MMVFVIKNGHWCKYGEQDPVLWKSHIEKFDTFDPTPHSAQLTAILAWSKDNLISDVFFSGYGITFTSKQDAVNFKLTWCE